jgi:AcrR family transcriptional regulator
MRTKRLTYHHGDLRRALLEAALEIVVEHGGPAAVTLREAARRAGVSHNAPYRHFADKGAILAALAEEGFTDLSTALRAARAGIEEAEERFVRTGLGYLRFAHERPGHIAVMFGPAITKGRTRELQRLANDAFQILKDLAIDAGVTEGQEARRLGTVAWSFLHGLAALTEQKQVPASVGASPDDLAALGLRHLFRSFRESRTKRR